MPNAVLSRLNDERSSLVEFIDTTLSRAAEDGRDLVEAELNNLESTRQRIGAIDAQMAPLAEFEAMRTSAVRVDSITSAPVREARAYTSPVVPPSGESFGMRITDSDEYRSWSGSGSNSRFGMELSVVPSELRAALVTTAPPGSGFMPSPYHYAAPAPNTTTPLLDAITHVPVSTGSVDIVTYGQEATGAAVVAEGADKPEATIATSVTPTPLETIAAWVEVSRQLLQDAPAARAIIDSQLTRGVLRSLENAVVAAIDAATIPDAIGAAGVPLIGVVRQGVAVVQSNGFSPDIVMGNPADLAELDLFLLENTMNGAQMSAGYWGLRPVPVPGLAPGDVYVADSAAAIILFERASVEVFMTDSDVTGAGKSGFRANLFTILAETRAKAAVVNTSAIVETRTTPALPLAARSSSSDRS